MKLAAYCELLERDLARSGDEDVPLRAKTFKLIWKTAKFKRGERSRTLPRYICKAADIHAVVAPLLERLLVEVLPPNGPGEFVLKRRYISCESCCQFDSPPPHILYFFLMQACASSASALLRGKERTARRKKESRSTPPAVVEVVPAALRPRPMGGTRRHPPRRRTQRRRIEMRMQSHLEKEE